jgi:hypothetical protein
MIFWMNLNLAKTWFHVKPRKYESRMQFL